MEDQIKIKQESAKVVSQEGISPEEAEKFLGTGHEPNAEKIYSCYFVDLDVALENKELNIDYLYKAVVSKKVLLRLEMLRQIEKEQHFNSECTFKSPKVLKKDKETGEMKLVEAEVCPACKGTGEQYKFAKKPIEVQCLKCRDVTMVVNGQEIVIHENQITVDGEDQSDNPRYQRFLRRVVEDCKSCGGTGRYVRKDLAKDLVINALCKTCKGYNIDGKSKTTQVMHKCFTCKGTGKLKIPVLAPYLKSTTVCGRCGGDGFVEIKPERQPMNPVVSEETADKLANLIKS